MDVHVSGELLTPTLKRKDDLKTYDTFSDHSGLLFYHIPPEGVNPFHGFTNIDRQRAIYERTKLYGTYITSAGDHVRAKHYGVPLRSDRIYRRMTSLRVDVEEQRGWLVNDMWLSLGKHMHGGYLPGSLHDLQPTKVSISSNGFVFNS